MATLTQTVTKELTWKAIASFCESGKAADLLAVGDVISITLKNDEKIRIVVAGINTYKPNEVVFTFKDILSKEAPMNKENTKAGGYDASDMAKYLDTEVFALLPDDLQKVIKERRGHKLWLHSRWEIFGSDGYCIYHIIKRQKIVLSRVMVNLIGGGLPLPVRRRLRSFAMLAPVAMPVAGAPLIPLVLLQASAFNSYKF